jgi:type II secretory pathway pseudopilin PulG
MTSQTDFFPTSRGGFSLVEVTIAIGIFAFVVVGIIGLLPAGMKMRADSAAETRGVLISEELFAAVRAAPGLTNVTFRRGPQFDTNNRAYVDLTLPSSDQRGQLVMGYPSQTTVPYWFFYENPGSSWSNVGGSDPEISKSAMNAIDTLARVSATNIGGNVYRVTVEVRAPASVPLANTRPSVFSTLVYSP